MKKTSLVLALVMLLSTLLVACGGTNNNGANNNGPAEAGAEATDISVGFVTDEGGVNDESFKTLWAFKNDLPASDSFHWPRNFILADSKIS